MALKDASMDEAIWPLEKVASKNSGTLCNQVYERLREWLRTGKLKEGDLLPSEREIAQMFDVSRAPVREALKVLEFVGIVEIVRGKGAFIKKIAAESIIDTIDFVMMNPSHTMLELFEVRQAIEVQAAFLAAERWTDEDMEAIETALAAYARQSDSQSLSVEPSLDFHSAIITASHNHALVEINQFLRAWLLHLRTKYIYPSGGSERGLAEHTELVALIRSRNGAGAAEKMRTHMTIARNILARTVTETDAANARTF